MPSLSFFADADDAGRLVEHLNQDPDLAFLVPLDPIGWPRPACSSASGLAVVEQQRWQAVQAVPSLRDGQHSLWHTPTGELLEPVPSRKLLLAPGTPIADPWSGWRGRSLVTHATAIPDVQAGLGHHGMVRLDLWTRHLPYSADERAAESPLVYYWTRAHEVLVASDFQWIGGRYQPAPKEMTRWWNGLKRWLSRACVKLTDVTGKQAFYAFPSAFALLRSGIKYEAHHWDLDASIQSSTAPRAT